MANSPAYFGFTGVIEPGGVGRIAGALNAAVNSGVVEVHLAFSSNGGYVADGIYLHNHIRALPLRLAIYNMGSVGSIAVSVFLAAAERYCSQHAMFMIHPTTMG
jgi:ATP-dependent Clp protease protease subunit